MLTARYRCLKLNLNGSDRAFLLLNLPTGIGYPTDRVGIEECDRFFIEAASIGGFSPELNETRLNRKPPASQ